MAILKYKFKMISRSFVWGKCKCGPPNKQTRVYYAFCFIDGLYVLADAVLTIIYLS
jgi:hypothetical protein